MVEQAPEVAGGEPGLAIQQQRPQLAAMADEGGGDQHLVMHGALPGRRRHASCGCAANGLRAEGG